MMKEAARWLGVSSGSSSHFIIQGKLSLINGDGVKHLLGQHVVTFHYGQKGYLCQIPVTFLCMLKGTKRETGVCFCVSL